MYNFLTLSTLFAAMAVGSALPSHVTKEFPSLTAHRERRVVYGVETEIEAVPYQVSLCVTPINRTVPPICGGMIISKDWILTAGHCIIASLTYHVSLGSKKPCSQDSIHEVNSTIIHEDFYIFGEKGKEKTMNDIALIKLQEPIVFDSVRKPIVLYNKDENVVTGSLAIVSGWGVINKDQNEYPDNLRSANVEITDINECIRRYHPGLVIQGQLCTMPKLKKTACRGDSGGPLVVNGRLAGIVTWGVQSNELPMFYTEISAYRDWIRNISSV